ncbi:hypothetical protein R5H30_13860 [Sulfitobacter sp. D35]|nr:hypothetical protein [Sulfitobacter sp. D35]MDW4499077.1 hypothetical protein [Sulfitobacter sp. D35]
MTQKTDKSEDKAREALAALEEAYAYFTPTPHRPNSRQADYTLFDAAA